MGKRFNNFKKGGKKFMAAYDGEMSHLLDDAADLVRTMSKD